VLSKTQYPALWAVLSTVAGNPHDGGGDNFIPPDYRGRYLKGTPVATAPGVSGGANTHTLAANELPAHTHAAGTLAAGTTGSGHNHGTRATQVLNRQGNLAGAVLTNLAAGGHTGTTDTSGTHTHTISGTTGDGGLAGNAHNNEPLNYTVRWFIKT
jgi:microcystin-dependent protein